MPLWTSRKQRLAIASVVVATALSLGGAGVTAHRVAAAPEQTASNGSSSAAPNSGVPLAAGGYTSDPSSPYLPPTSSPGRPGSTPATPPSVPSVPSAPQLAADGIPAVALDAYRKAAARVAGTYPGCGLPWPLLAAIGRVESDHGRFGGSQLYTDGTDAPRVIGIALNGNGTALIRDTDHGRLDGDTVYDHAVGPMQFIPSTWATWGVDGNGDGVASPFNIYDATLAAADYLCAAGGNLQTAAGQIRAVLAYNDSAAYLATVLSLEKIYASGQPGVTIPILPSQPKPPAHEKPLPPPVNPGPPLALTTPPASKSKTGPGSSGPGTPSQPGTGPGSSGSGTTSPTPPSTGGSTTPGSPGAPPSWPVTSPPGSGSSAPPSSSSPPPTDTPPTADLAVAPTTGGGPLDVTADASKSTDDTSGLTYTFDFGDGTAVVGPQSEATATHTYQAGGSYAVQVTVTDSAGQTSTKTVDITVTAPAAASSSGTSP